MPLKLLEVWCIELRTKFVISVILHCKQANMQQLSKESYTLQRQTGTLLSTPEALQRLHPAAAAVLPFACPACQQTPSTVQHCPRPPDDERPTQHHLLLAPVCCCQGLPVKRGAANVFTSPSGSTGYPSVRAQQSSACNRTFGYVPCTALAYCCYLISMLIKSQLGHLTKAQAAALVP